MVGGQGLIESDDLVFGALALEVIFVQTQVVHQGVPYGTAIGMGRLVGDGGCFFQVVDIAVDPAHQGRGLGKAIMAALTVFMADKLPPSAYVSLIADVPAQELYKQFGFQETAPRSLGMARRAG